MVSKDLFYVKLNCISLGKWPLEYALQLQNSVRKYLNRGFKYSWRLDETYVKVKGKWCHLYRIIDKAGKTINFDLSKTRDHQAALICIHGAIRIAGFIPDKINSDGNQANELAVKIINHEHNLQEMLANPDFYGPLELTITYTKVKYFNNMIEPDHKKVKKITNPMLGFKEFNSASDTIAGIEAIGYVT